MTTLPNQPTPPKNGSNGSVDSVSVLGVLDIFKRRKLAFLVPVLLCTVGAVAWALYLPERFEARVLMRLSMSSDRGQGWGNPAATVRGQLSSIRESVNRRTIVETVVSEFGLFEVVDEQVSEFDLDQMRNSIGIMVQGDETFYFTYSDTDPERAAGVVNRIAELLEQQDQARRDSRIEARVQLITADLQEAEQELIDKQNAIARADRGPSNDLPEDLQVYLGSLSDTTSQLQETKRRIDAAEAERARVLSELRSIEELGAQPAQGGIMADPRVTELQRQLDDARQRGWTNEHPQVKNLLSQLERLVPMTSDGESTTATNTLATADTNLQLRWIQLEAQLEGLDRELELAREDNRQLVEALSEFRDQAETTSERERQLMQLIRDADESRDRYLLLQSRLQEALFEARLQDVGGVGLRVAETARVPTMKSAPSRSRIAGLGIFFGLVLGAALVLMLEQVDTSFSDVSELWQTTGLPTLAALPTIRNGVLPRVRKPLLPTVTEPASIGSEQYRILASRLRQMMDRNCAQVVVFTSSGGSEGKTTTAMNVAVALSQIQPDRVLLIDLDLRRPQVREYMKGASISTLGTEGGVVDLFETSDGPGATVFGRIGNLSVLAPSSGVSDPYTTMTSAGAKRTISRLRKQFRYIVMDSPPVLPVVDFHLLSELSDTAVFVVRARQTRSETLTRALDSFDTAHLLGLVLNDVDFTKTRYGKAYQKYAKDQLEESKPTGRSGVRVFLRFV